MKKIIITADQWHELFTTIALYSLSTQTICKNMGLCFQTVWRKIGDSEKLCERYARAKEEQSDILAEEILTIADEIQEDSKIGYNKAGKPYIKINREHFESKRLRIDTRKWIASKLKPKKYGDTKTNLLGNVDDQKPFEVNFNIPSKKVSNKANEKCNETTYSGEGGSCAEEKGTSG